MSDPRNSRQLLEAQWGNGKFLCIGLDPDRTKIAAALKLDRANDDNVVNYLAWIIEATADFGGAYKPNRSFFGGPKGAITLDQVMNRLRMTAADSCHILDGKYGDIGNSNRGYDQEAFDCYEADAMTAHGYLGGGTWQMSLDREDKAIFFLCRTSNPEATELQDKLIVVPITEIAQILGCNESQAWGFAQETGWSTVGGQLRAALPPTHEYVAFLAEHKWKGSGITGLVVGATAPEQLARVRQIAPTPVILIPGVGKQGGDLEKAVRNGIKPDGTGILVNASSSILYAFEQRGGDFAEAARAEAEMLHDQITRCREGVTA